jgi:hypothetical protein
MKTEVGMITWRTNAATHYMKDGKPLCGANMPYGESWFAWTTDENGQPEPSCEACRRAFRKENKEE